MKSESNELGCHQKTLKFLAKLTRCRQGSTYYRMDDGRDKSSKKAKVTPSKQEDKGKASYKTLANKEVRERAAKKKGWKRVQQAALASCRYIGLGAVHLNPAAMYPAPEYSIDPKLWNRSFSSSYKPQIYTPTPHWSNNMVYSVW